MGGGEEEAEEEEEEEEDDEDDAAKRARKRKTKALKNTADLKLQNLKAPGRMAPSHLWRRPRSPRRPS